MSEQTKRVLAIISVVVGLMGLACALVPACGVIVSIGGLVCGILAARSESKVLAIIGIVSSSLALLAAIAHMALSAYFLSTGQNPILEALRENMASDAGMPDASSMPPDSDVEVVLDE